MKKNTCLLLVVLLPFLGISQGVKANLFDKFLKKQRIETEPVIISGLPENNELAIEFSALASALYLNLRGTGWGASTIDKGNELVFYFSNDQSLSLKAASLQSFERGSMQNVYRHQYILHRKDLEMLSKLDLVSLRKYSFNAYSDLTLPAINREGIRKMSALFLAALKDAGITGTLAQINVKDIRDYMGDSVTFCSKVYRTRYFKGSDEGPTLLDVQADFSDPFVNVVILERDRHKFGNAPENSFLNRDVCISGVVHLRNNVPYLVLHESNQIRLSNPGEGSVADGGGIRQPSSMATQRETAQKKEGSGTGQAGKEARAEGSPSETLAEFPGGPDAFMDYLDKNLVNPVKTKTAGERQVIAAFEIDAQGNCSHIKIVASAGPAYDEEVKRVLTKMPKWKPAFANGRFVGTRITQPIKFGEQQAKKIKGT
jgi:hypothetical protein